MHLFHLTGLQLVRVGRRPPALLGLFLMPVTILIFLEPLLTSALSDWGGAAMTSHLAALFVLAAGIRVGVTLVDDAASGVLRRLLLAPIPRHAIALAGTLAAIVIAVVQVALLSICARLLFDVSSVDRLVWLALVAVTAGFAAAGIGLCLAAVSNGRRVCARLAVAVFAVMSVIGGSLVPWVLMPPWLGRATLATFNGWAAGGMRAALGPGPGDPVWRAAAVLGAAGLTLHAVALAVLGRRLRRAYEQGVRPSPCPRAPDRRD